ncbi:MAG: hypothetical protein OD815_000147 [Candidatus Alkanophagales archaeon MCA70_species_2]|nr:hypothetical protein [Candidatus Alkanophaga liquidiphilum]
MLEVHYMTAAAVGVLIVLTTLTLMGSIENFSLKASEHALARNAASDVADAVLSCLDAVSEGGCVRMRVGLPTFPETPVVSLNSEGKTLHINVTLDRTYSFDLPLKESVNASGEEKGDFVVVVSRDDGSVEVRLV